MVTAQDIYLTARKLVGTPWLHQARLPGIGIDCLGVAMVTANQLNLIDYDVTDYPRDPDGSMNRRIAEKFPTTTLQVGAFLVFGIRCVPQHCGIVSKYMDGLGIIHAWDVAGQVVEHRLNQQWLDRVVGIYGFPGVLYYD